MTNSFRKIIVNTSVFDRENRKPYCLCEGILCEALYLTNSILITGSITAKKKYNRTLTWFSQVYRKMKNCFYLKKNRFKTANDAIIPIYKIGLKLYPKTMEAIWHADLSLRSYIWRPRSLWRPRSWKDETKSSGNSKTMRKLLKYSLTIKMFLWKQFWTAKAISN